MTRTITVQPFLATLAPARAPTPFVMALPVVATKNGSSPWSPQPHVPSASAIDVEAIRRDAIAKGREDGLRETAAMRAQLQKMMDALTVATANATATQAAAIADAATTIVSAWLGSAPSFKPIVDAWLAKCSEPSQARVHPSSLTALTETVGDAPIAIVADASVAPNDIALSAPAFELHHKWADRLAALRLAIQAQLEAPP